MDKLFSSFKHLSRKTKLALLYIRDVWDKKVRFCKALANSVFCHRVATTSSKAQNPRDVRPGSGGATPFLGFQLRNSGLFNFVFPAFCLGCEQYLGWGANPHELCLGCRQKLRKNYEETTHVFTGFNFLEKLYVFGKYGEEPLTTLIHKTKYQNKAWALEPLLKELDNYLAGLGLNQVIDAVTSVALHPKRLRERGFNQAALIAQRVAGILKKPLYSDILKRTKFTKPQMNIKDNRKRFHNVRGVFEITEKWRGQCEGQKILLVDDVATTGATLQECARCLRKVGYRVFGFVLAH